MGVSAAIAVFAGGMYVQGEQAKDARAAIEAANKKLKAAPVLDAATTREAQASAANRTKTAAGGTGRGGTILTSPLGLINEPAGATKQLLGA
jgi:hypothetical protein